MIPSVLPTYSRAPLSFVKGEGSWLIEADGRRFLDLGAGIAVNALGHAHPALVAALTYQAGKLWHVSNLYTIPQQQALADSLSDHIAWEDAMETGEELVFLRTGLRRDTLKKLRRGHWVLQAELDLHGLVSVEARQAVNEFVAGCSKRGLRCVRIIHGKGLRSKNREPVLRTKVKNWLMQKDEVLAFCQARAVDGGSGAVVVLLKSS